MLPSKNDGKWIRLVMGDIEHDFKSVPAGLMLSVMKRNVRIDNSNENITRCVYKTYNFFQRFESILQEDINAVFFDTKYVPGTGGSIIKSNNNTLATIKEAIKMIEAGEVLILAGDESALSSLPPGKWIGGTIPYFMSESGGISAKDRIFVSKITDFAKSLKIKLYEANAIDNIIADSPDHGFSFIIIPATSSAHIAYAHEAPMHQNLFMKQIIGWISGVNVDHIGKISPKVFDGSYMEKTDTKAIVMHITLPANKIAKIGIINIFKPGMGDSIQFIEEGFSAKDCLINGIKKNFSEYLLSRKINTKLPLVANYCGTRINVSIQQVDEKNKIVNFYAPVFHNTIYKFASPVNDYISEFMKFIPRESISPEFSCNCILNYLYSELEGKKTGGMTGPMTFGEIAYQLLNQTLVYLEIRDTLS